MWEFISFGPDRSLKLLNSLVASKNNRAQYLPPRLLYISQMRRVWLTRSPGPLFF